MSDQLTQSINLDARVVKTVRNLKKDLFGNSDGSGDSSNSSKSQILSNDKSEEKLKSRDSKNTKSEDSIKEEKSLYKKEVIITSKINSINKNIDTSSKIKK
jgi:hypothetical protein